MGFSLKKTLNKTIGSIPIVKNIASTNPLYRLAAGKSLIGKDLKGGDIPGYDTSGLQSESERAAQIQRDLIQQRFGDLGTARTGYKTEREKIGSQIVPGVEKRLSEYGQQLQGVGQTEREALAKAADLNAERSFREVPEVQRLIRNQLGGARLGGNVAAMSALTQPLTQAYQSAADFRRQGEMDQLVREGARAEGLAQTGFSTRMDADLKKLGFDEETLNSLTDEEKAAIQDKYTSLMGVEATRSGQKMDLMQQQQQADIARAQAAAQKKAGLLGTIGQIGGTVVGGMFGGPIGAGIGSQLGGMLGNYAGGGQVSGFDPTLVASLFQGKGGGLTANTAFGAKTPVRAPMSGPQIWAMNQGYKIPSR